MIELHCDECNELIGYMIDTGPRGFVVCPDCHDKDKDKQDG